MTERELDQAVVGMELTLISIIQGVALSFLAVSTSGVLAARRYDALPYAITGLLVICAVWSRAVLHVLTIVRWPLELARSVLYFAIALGQSLMFAAIDAPLSWHALGALTGVAAWLTYAVDLRLIDRDLARAPRGSALELVRRVRRDQLVHLRIVVPAATGFYILALALLLLAPGPLLDGRWHVVLGLAQVLLFAGYNLATMRLARELVPLIGGASSGARPR